MLNANIAPQQLKQHNFVENVVVVSLKSPERVIPVRKTLQIVIAIRKPRIVCIVKDEG